ncbi:MAG TPA: rhomboid family intramembrane serine protease [Candidatus Baltobacteraceae bacterium]|jgi:membrane associated rhomboid family serine protease|nr:rhomboid family intramembrane serine protease [Candidatus Baltobacteraceae bacterium]
MTTILLITLVACYIVQIFFNRWKGEPWVMDWLALSRSGLAQGRVYQLITFQFLHGGVWHLLGNMIGLYFFGRAMEAMLGSRGMLKLYLASGTIGGLLQIALGFAFPNYFGGGVVGASAGVFGLIAAFATHAPDDPITLLLFFVLPVTFPAKVLLIAEGAFAVLGVIGPLVRVNIFDPGVAHAAHLGGMLTGIVWIRLAMSPNPSFQFWRSLTRRGTPRREPAAAPAKRIWKTARKKPEELPPGEFISREVDPILEKISAQGIQSLTARERQILEAARSKMAKR